MRNLLSFTISILLFAGLVLAGCDSGGGNGDNGDDGPGPSLSVSDDLLSLEYNAGAENASTTFEVTFEALDEGPNAEASAGLSVEVAEESEGTVVYEVISQPVGELTEGTVTVTGSAGEEDFEETVDVEVEPTFTSLDFNPTFASIADYENEDGAIEEPRGWEATDGVTVSIDSSEFSTSSNGVASLLVDGSGTVTLNRTVSASGQLSFLVNSGADSQFTLSLNLVDGDGNEHALDLPIAPVGAWQKIEAPLDSIGDGFEGTLQRLEMSTEADVAFNVDSFFFGEGESTVEIEDFENTSNPYGIFNSNLTLGYSDNVADNAYGTTSRSFSMESGDGDNFFGYNFCYCGDAFSAEEDQSLLFPEVDQVSMRIGNVSESFTLYVFVESARYTDSDGEIVRSGGLAYSGGIEYEIEAGDDWTTIREPIENFVNPDAKEQSGAEILDERPGKGFVNLGFEIRNAPSNGVDFLLDDLRLEKAN